MKEILDLFWVFIIIGASAFGGGYSLLPILERELIKKRGWINMDEVMDYFSIAQVTPGVIAINVSTFVGYKRKGVAGGIVATIGFIIPGVTLMILASFFIRQFSDSGIITHAFAGIRIAVGALILSAIIKIVRGFFKNYKTIIIYLIALILSAVFSVSPVFIVLGAALAGFLFFPVWRNKKSDAGPDAGNPKDTDDT